MCKEIFKDIPNYKGHYQVSNLGNIKSIKFKNIVFIKSFINNSGYETINLYKDGITEKILLHQLVAIAFLNHKRGDRKIVVDHINNIKTDNRLKNLQIITNRKNCSKDRKNSSSQYVGVHWCKTTNKWISKIRIDKIQYKLGSFDNEFKASEAYQNELKKITT